MEDGRRVWEEGGTFALKQYTGAPTFLAQYSSFRILMAAASLVWGLSPVEPLVIQLMKSKSPGRLNGMGSSLKTSMIRVR